MLDYVLLWTFIATMKRIFFLILFLLITVNFVYAKKKKSTHLNMTDVMYYPLDHGNVLAERFYDKEQHLNKIKFEKFPDGTKEKLYGFVFSFKPNQYYRVKEFGLNKKEIFTHSFEILNNTFVLKAYYPHLPNEKIQSSKILYQIQKFNLSGHIQEKTFYNRFNHPTPNDSGVASTKYIYDTNKNLIQQVSKDWKNRVHPDKDGIGIRNYTYDAKNRLTSKTYFRKEGVPRATEYKLSKVEYGYDESCSLKINLGNKAKQLLNDISFSHKDIAVNCVNSVQFFKFSPECIGYCPAEDKHGIHFYSFEYDEKCLSNRSSIFFLMEDRVSSCMRIKQVLNAVGHNVKYPHPYSVFSIYENKEILDTFIEEGKLKSSLVMEKIIDKNTGIKTTIYEVFDSNRKPTLIENISKAISKEDSKGNILLNEYFGIDKKPTLDDSGISREVFEYNETCLNLKKFYRECIQSEEYFDTQGHYIKAQNGKYPRITTTFDGKGNKTKVNYYVSNSENQVRLLYSEIFKYDTENNLIFKKLFSPDGKPFALVNGVHNIFYKYDRECLKLNPHSKEECYKLKINKGTDGKLVEFLIARQFRKFHKGKLIYSASYNKDGHLVNSQEGFAKMEKTLDKKGNIIQIQYMYLKEEPFFYKLQKALGNTDNNPVHLEKHFMNSKGYRTIRKLDSDGNLIEIQLLDEKNREIEFETFTAKGYLTSFDYSYYFYLKNNDSFRLKLDKYKRPTSVEFISASK